MAPEQTAFQIDARDNVATALTPLAPGAVRVLGDAPGGDVAALEEIPVGHKISLRGIADGDDVIKYGVSIGRANKPVARGAWVHLHCMGSRFDEKSNRLDPVTGVSTDADYD